MKLNVTTLTTAQLLQLRATNNVKRANQSLSEKLVNNIVSCVLLFEHVNDLTHVLIRASKWCFMSRAATHNEL